MWHGKIFLTARQLHSVPVVWLKACRLLLYYDFYNLLQFSQNTEAALENIWFNNELLTLIKPDCV